MDMELLQMEWTKLDTKLTDVLPAVTIPITKPTFFEKTTFIDYSEFIEQFTNCISGSCWALVVDSEIIWNDYDDSRNFKEIIMAGVLREAIINDPRCIIKKATTMDIYMFQENIQKYKIHILDNTFKFSFFKFIK